MTKSRITAIIGMFLSLVFVLTLLSPPGKAEAAVKGAIGKYYKKVLPLDSRVQEYRL